MCSTIQSYFSIYTMYTIYKSSYVLGKCILNTYMCIDNYYSYVILCACVPLYRVTLAYIQCIQYIKVAMSWVSVYLNWQGIELIAVMITAEALQPLPILYRRTVKLWMVMQTHAHTYVYKHQH